MSYEVIKAIGSGKYRYSVESYRDEDGKTRTRWHYLGKAEGVSSPRRRSRAGETRLGLISALERRLALTDWAGISTHDIAIEAGVAPATFYRHFKSRDDILRACAVRAIEAQDAGLNELVHVASDLASERARLRNWTIATIADTSASAIFIALSSSGSVRDELARQRNERRRAAFEDYLVRLIECGFVSLDPAAARELAIALALIVQAFSYRVVLGRVELLGEERDALANAVERLIFAE